MAGEQRFVISARVIGAVYRDAPKLKVSEELRLFYLTCFFNKEKKRKEKRESCCISVFDDASACSSLPPQMFMLSVIWSDNTEVIVYRSFQEFKKFHVSF